MGRTTCGALIAALGARSLLYSLIGPAVGGRGWAPIVGMPDVSPTAAAEHGVSTRPPSRTSRIRAWAGVAGVDRMPGSIVRSLTAQPDALTRSWSQVEDAGLRPNVHRTAAEVEGPGR